MSLWTPDRLLALRNLSDLGFEPGKIAACLGDQISRAAVINKLHDLGLPCKFARQEERREKFKPPRHHGPSPITLAPIPRARETANT